LSSIVSDIPDPMDEPFRRCRMFACPSSRRRLWRQMVAALALIALVFPSLGVLPWIAASSVPGAVTIGQHAHGADERDGPHQHDASDIPGSPLHPIDHDCFPCQVLAHLSRCTLFAPAIGAVAAVPPCPVQPPPIAVLRMAASVANLPPVRAPPAGIA